MCVFVCTLCVGMLFTSSDLPIQKLLLESRETNSEVTLELLPSNVNTAAPPSLHRDIHSRASDTKHTANSSYWGSLKLVSSSSGNKQVGKANI